MNDDRFFGASLDTTESYYPYYYEDYFPPDKHVRRTLYVAKITGEHPVYRLRRRFIHPRLDFDFGGKSYTFPLRNGLYEIGYNTYNIKTGVRVSRQRSWLIVLGDKDYEYEYDELDTEFVAVSAFNLWLQYCDFDWVCQRFFGEEAEALA